MAGEGISNEARQFLTDHITSVAQLEALLLLQLNSQEAWTAEQLGRELRTDATWLEHQLEELRGRGLLECLAESGPRYRYRPRTPELEQAVTALAQAYLVHRVSVIELVYSRTPGPLRAFSDAFRLRRDEPHG